MTGYNAEGAFASLRYIFLFAYQKEIGMTFKENRMRFLAKDTLVFMGCCVTAVILFVLTGYHSVARAYIWALTIYSSLILLGPVDISKTCVDKKVICFSLCVVGGVIMSVLGKS